jgi:hypothetical protein
MYLKEFGKDIWTIDGPTVSFLGCPYPTRCAVVKLSTGGAWIWSPVQLTEEIAEEVIEKAGDVKLIVAPNKIHHLALKQWKNRFPKAILYGAPGLDGRSVVKDIKFDGVLSNQPYQSYSTDLEQVLFSGSCFMDEVVFFHKPSRTALFTDLIQRFPENQIPSGLMGSMMKLDGLVGKHGSTPRDYRLTFLFGKSRARAALAKINLWHAEKLIIAHGDCAESGAEGIIKEALSWV